MVKSPIRSPVGGVSDPFWNWDTSTKDEKEETHGQEENPPGEGHSVSWDGTSTPVEWYLLDDNAPSGTQAYPWSDEEDEKLALKRKKAFF